MRASLRVLITGATACVLLSGVAEARTVNGCAIKAKTSCAGKNLRGQNLRGVNLRKANLRGADISNADLSGADLTSANLYGAKLFYTKLDKANLTSANLYAAKLFYSKVDAQETVDHLIADYRAGLLPEPTLSPGSRSTSN